MKRGCGSSTDVMLAHSLCLSGWLLVVGYRCHCFHSISQQSALVGEKCFFILELCLWHIKASSLSCRFFISHRNVCVFVCVCPCLSLLSTVRAYSYCSLTSWCVFFFFLCAQVWMHVCICLHPTYRECWWIYFRLKESRSKGIALVWQQTFKACWKHSHLNKASFIKSQLALFTNWMLVPFSSSFVFQNWQNRFQWLFYMRVSFGCTVLLFDWCVFRCQLIVAAPGSVNLSLMQQILSKLINATVQLWQCFAADWFSVLIASW